MQDPPTQIPERHAGLESRIADAMPTKVFMLDARGRVTYRNPRWDEYTGPRPVLDPEGGDEWEWSLIHPSDRVSVEDGWRRALEAPEDLPDGRVFLRYRMLRHDGAWRWHAIEARARHDEQGELVGWVGTATEIDTQRRNEIGQRVLSDVGGVLVSSTDVARALASVADLTVPAVVDLCAIDLVRRDGTAVRVTEQVGHDIPEPSRARLASFLSAEQADRVRREEDIDGDVLLLDRTGERLEPESDDAVAAMVPLAVRGERIGMLTLAMAELGREFGGPEVRFARALATRLATGVDAMRLYLRAEERAQASEVLDAIADGVALIDREGVVRLWNPAAALITGVPASDILGRPASDVLADWDALVERVPIARDARHRSTVSTAPLSTRDGRDIWLSVSAVGFALGVAYAFRDLTDERAVERMKSDFVATVSHELRTPLASIYGAAVTLQRDDLELDDELQAQLLDIIGQQSQQLAHIVDDVLTASRLDAGDPMIETKPVDAVELARDSLEATRRRLDLQHDLELHVADEVPPVAADPSHLRQVLDNLLENAIKYSPEGGAIDVIVGHSGGVVTFTVRDTGLGIPANEQERVFDKFYRVDADMSLGIGGTGLGLFIVRELVRRMEGEIAVASTPGAGSSFTVTLPCATTRP